ncbi:adhesion G -coupled receptor F5 isoform X1 [Pelobates cultripes]|uniref:Adhesion G -coupled receptor F5 isoform X1 n=1 Tax=Pelobates cultripes TaxID=61616 RepID=A0AAD1R9A6_PELCU|nr:adhesion G -coupled receptor F5 isoform X1 [Pelobates cultripes]
MHLLSLPVLFLLSSFMIPAEATFNLDFSSLLSTLLKSENNGAESGYVPGSSLSRHKRAALDAEYTVDIEVSFQDPTLQDTIKNFINGLTYPLNLTAGTTIQSINVTTACTQVGTNLQCKCEEGFIWSTDICSNYTQCSDNSTVSSCNCINMTENTGQYCQAATTMSTTTAMTTLSITTPLTTMTSSTTMSSTIPMSTTRTTTLSTTSIPSTTMNTTILLSTTRTTTLSTTTIPSTTMSTTTPKSTTITTTPTTTKTTTRTTTTKSATITVNPQKKSLSLGINEIFTEDLKNTSSPKYNEYKNKLDTALSESYKSLPGFISAAVTGFRPGSVVADYTITADQFDASSIQAANNNLLTNLTGIFNLTNPPILNIFTDNITLDLSTEFQYLGDNVTFFCNVSINSYSTINWYLNGSLSIPNATNKTNVQSGMISFTLTISPLTASNAGTYFCIVNQDTNSYQASKNLTVQTIQMNILNGNVICNDTAMSVLSCCPSSGENTLTLSCQNISGNYLTTKSVFWNNVSSCQELQIKATQNQCVSYINTYYSCVCWSNNGAITNQSITVTYLTLQIYPVVDIFKVSQGKVLNLECNESDSITWKFSSTGNSLTAMPISQTYYTNVGKRSTLTIPSDTLNTNWNGTYYCFSNNITTSRRVDVYSLIPASQIQIQPANFSYVCGTFVTFTCCVNNINNYPNAKLIISNEEQDMTRNAPEQCYTLRYSVPLSCGSSITATCKIFNLLNDSVTSMPMTGNQLPQNEVTCNDTIRLVGKDRDNVTILCSAVNNGLTGNITYICIDRNWMEVKALNFCVSAILNRLSLTLQALTSPDSEAQLPDVLKNIYVEVNNDSNNITSSSNNLALVVSMLSQVNNIATTVQESLMEDFLRTASIVVNNSSINTWKTVENPANQSSSLLQSVENFANKLVFSQNVNITTTNIQLEGIIVDKNTAIFAKPFRFASDITDSDLTGSVLIGNVLASVPQNSSIVSIAYSTLKDIIPSGNNKQVLNGLVMTTTIPNITNSFVDFKINMEFKMSNTSLSKPQCVFWNFKTEAWDGTGCKSVGNNSVNVSCECTHLTSFSILMSYGDNSPDPVLDYITYIGVGISLLSLVICIGVEATVWKSVTKNKTSYMRHVCIINIAVSLLLADIWFIIGAALSPKSGESVSDACVATTFFTHFFYLSVFFWMLTMGLILFYRLVYVLHDMSKTNMMTISFALGYGCPLVISVITVAVTKPRNMYTSSNACWLNTTESNAFIAFVVPALAILLVNVMIVFVVLKKLCRPAVGDKQKKDDSSTLKHIAKCILILTPLLGLTWGFGIGTMASKEKWIHGIFAALNSLQGLFILLFGCLMDKKVREALLHTFSLSRFTSQQTKSTNTNSSDSPFSKTVMNKGVFNLFHKKGAYNISSAHVSSSSDIPSNSYSLLH